MHVRYSYLPQQFNNCDDLWIQLKDFVSTGDFTLGKPLAEFESRFSQLIGTKYALGVNSGTDAIKLSLKAGGVKPGDEVLTAANTFVATVGAICEIGAVPVFVDCNDTFCMETSLIEEKITPKTTAIVPVHFSGYMVDMRNVKKLAEHYNLLVVEDACQSILGAIDNRKAGTWGHTGAFSLHPLKNLNVWSDGGVIVTDDKDIFETLKLIRNHGLVDRDTVQVMGYNSRLDTFQAVVGNWLIPQTEDIAEKRITNARRYDAGLESVQQIRIPPRPEDFRIVYHLYMIFAEQRDKLLAYLQENGVEAKIHYPVPMYRQPAMQNLGHKMGDFPVADQHARELISFPCDQHLSDEEIDYVIEKVKEFYL